MKTNDERLNELEDTVRTLKEAVNHNNRIFRLKDQERLTKIQSLEKRVVELERNPSTNVAFGDIFNGVKK